jgi:hypothetical protein
VFAAIAALVLVLVAQGLAQLVGRSAPDIAVLRALVPPAARPRWPWPARWRYRRWHR